MDIATQTYADATPSGFGAYLFPRVLDFNTAGTYVYNAADPLFSAGFGPNIPIYGLGDVTNSYPKFENVAFPLVNSTFNYSIASRKLTAPGGNATGQYELAVQDDSLLRIELESGAGYVPKNYLFARSAIVPHDIRIEAAMYAERGSFFVIPGPWFNTVTQDTREAFEVAVGGLGLDAAQRQRFEQFGNSPEVPFYGEPLNVRVVVHGAISENMPPPMSQQAEWLKKWGWMPVDIGGTGLQIPQQHVPAGYNPAIGYVPNMILEYDPVLANASADGINALRWDADGWVLPPMPRLPVSPTLAYTGEVNP